MRILSFKPGHDGTIAIVDNGKLLLSLEAEKDSFPRYNTVTPNAVLSAMSYLDGVSDIVAVSGWVKGDNSVERPLGAGYFGFDESAIYTKKVKFLGKEVDYFTSSHERSHLLCAYGMSPLEQGEPCYVLLWEGILGDFYEIDLNIKIKKLGKVLEEPGNKYAFLFSLADPTFPPIKGFFLLENAGKLMALTGFSDYGSMTREEREVTEYILDNVMLLQNEKAELKWSRFFNIGVEHPEFKNLAGKFSNALFDRFYEFAKAHLTKKLPLLISGGCGLNCDWNTKWKETSMFSSVFVPPCSNDTGSAIGTAIDAQFYYTGNAKLSWDVYAGEDFVDDIELSSGEFEIFPLDYHQVAAFLLEQKVIAWIQGRYEMGPRALGNRSILAAPFEKQMHNRLNQIKQREGYRPIAPVCIEEDVSQYFEWTGPSPYMLYFQKLKTDRLPAVTHVDNTARLQTVNATQNSELYNLLTAFKKLTSFSVLCNTSLNFKGKGFINSMSDLIEYCKDRSLDGFVVQDKFYVLRQRL